MRRFSVPAFFLVVLVCVLQLVIGPGVAAEGADPLQPDAATSIYWVEWDSDQILRGNADGSGNPLSCLAITANVSGMAIDSDAGKMYWLERDLNRLRSANLNCSGVTTLSSALENADRLTLDLPAGKLYWTENNGTNRIRRANLNGTDVETVIGSLGRPIGIAVDTVNGFVYWTELDSRGVWRATLAGTNKTMIVPPVDAQSTPLDIGVDPVRNKIYWAVNGIGAIYSATLTGSGDGLWLNLGDPRYVTVDSESGRVYWVDWDTLEIRRANSDSSNNQLLFTSADGVIQPRGVALGYSPVTCYSLTRTHTGQGNDPVASPNKSTECSVGQYVAGENITLTATPAAGWGVAGWSGTNNDGSTATTNTVTMPPNNHTVSVAYEQTGPTCYTLTRTHTGQGNNPVATPGKSPACGTGEYVAGENITLTATPATGWRVAGWSGTNNDGSTATTNTMTMPATAHTVSVAYEQAPPTCFALTRNHSGQGNNPVAVPALSAGCGTGQYVAGELITLTATPSAGWSVAGWNGTNNDGSTATTNTVTMPATPHTVSVIYEQTPPTCRTLTRNHTGQGNNPVAAPAFSVGCGTGQYVAGELITLTATPAAGWSVAGWSGTNNDGSTATTNTVTMPATNHVISVAYEQNAILCYTLTRVHTGQGGDPVATPNKSAACGTGQYVAGENITLTASPAAGWRVAGWSGTSNDGSTSSSNTLVMPAAVHTARVNYVQQPGDESRAVMPFVIYGLTGFLGPMESEPNNSITQANGPILLNRTYQGFPNDLSDYYSFDLATPRELTITLTGITGTDPQLHLYHESTSNRVGYDPDAPYSIAYSAQPGRYYVRVVVVGNYNSNIAYTLRVDGN